LGGGESSRKIFSFLNLVYKVTNDFPSQSAPPVMRQNEQYTLELHYNCDTFADCLREALEAKVTRMRMWNGVTKAYETVTSEKTVEILPSVLSICCGAGRKEEGVWGGQQDWFPETMTVAVDDDGTVKVNAEDTYGEKVRGVGRHYTLIAAVSFVTDTAENNETGGSGGHHVVHIKIPTSYKRETLQKQMIHIKECWNDALRFEYTMTSLENDDDKAAGDIPVLPHLTMASQVPSNDFQERMALVKERMDVLDKSQGEDEWVLFNGFVVSKSDLNDARDFRMGYKRPCILLYRDITDWKQMEESRTNVQDDVSVPSLSMIPNLVLPHDLPGKNELIAIDTEFVLVQHEQSTLKPNGSKVTITEGRHNLARVSVVNCQNQQILIDDFVLPQEPVVDYLTRFSGIRPKDLDPMTSERSLVPLRMVYLKLRLLLDRGCIFIGHGLSQDFRILNIFVPPKQIIDTVQLFHMDNSRMISLRFLANYLLGHDMQQDTHDSIEDAKTAYEIYLKAVELKSQGEGHFDAALKDIYEFGRRTDWKLGVDERL